ncbi:hypothetical protein GW17_00001429 [Ensete ventricosum]|nr:hypothetical protein GW17_00001429 [Ensete ventricosum]
MIVLDVSQGMTGEKLLMLKHVMWLVVSYLSPGARLSIVASRALQMLRDSSLYDGCRGKTNALPARSW